MLVRKGHADGALRGSTKDYDADDNVPLEMAASCQYPCVATPCGVLVAEVTFICVSAFASRDLRLERSVVSLVLSREWEWVPIVAPILLYNPQ